MAPWRSLSPARNLLGLMPDYSDAITSTGAPDEPQRRGQGRRRLGRQLERLLRDRLDGSPQVVPDQLQVCVGGWLPTAPPPVQ